MAQRNDAEFAFLRGEGYQGALPDMRDAYFRDNGYNTWRDVYNANGGTGHISDWLLEFFLTGGTRWVLAGDSSMFIDVPSISLTGAYFMEYGYRRELATSDQTRLMTDGGANLHNLRIDGSVNGDDIDYRVGGSNRLLAGAYAGIAAQQEFVCRHTCDGLASGRVRTTIDSVQTAETALFNTTIGYTITQIASNSQFMRAGSYIKDVWLSSGSGEQWFWPIDEGTGETTLLCFEGPGGAAKPAFNGTVTNPNWIEV